ncbi:MAG: tRNA (guanosine(46)-N7)-methyltransferase TrmB [Methylococcales bacterium]|nr:tRNA (guanosine(46)-N7)-methyltransferase TrmB [Methylococcales bacterium]
MTFPDPPPVKPRIRSFILRQGRTTAGQKLAIETLWETYCLDPTENLDFRAIFNNSAPVILEIGFGNGDSLAKMAEANPDKNYLGIEVHKPGVGHLMLRLAEKKLTNVRIFHHDAIEILEQRVSDQSIYGVQLFFPDPWHKRRHHKRRIVSEHFLTLLSKKLMTGGYFHTATDWEGYAIYMLKKLKEHSEFINQDSNNGYCERPDYRPLTKFEQRGVRLGHGVWDLIFKKQ